MLFFLSVLSTGGKELDVILKDLKTLQFDAKAGEVHEIILDRSYVSLVFPSLSNTNIGAYIEENDELYNIGSISKSNGRYGIRCGSKICSFKYRSTINNTGIVHIIPDSLKCNRTYISTKSNESFEISSNKYSNYTKNDHNICFIYIPAAPFSFNASIQGSSIQATYNINSSLNEKRMVGKDSNIDVLSSNHVVFSFQVTDSLNNSSFVFRSTHHENTQRDNDEFSIDYYNNDETFFMTKIGKEPVDTIVSDSNKKENIDLYVNQEEEDIEHFDENENDNNQQEEDNNDDNNREEEEQEEEKEREKARYSLNTKILLFSLIILIVSLFIILFTIYSFYTKSIAVQPESVPLIDKNQIRYRNMQNYAI